MGLKKISIYILIGFVASGIIFGALFYFLSNKQPKEVAITYKTYEYNIGEFSTNLGTTRNYFKGSIIIETIDEEVPIKLGERNAGIRDSILSILIGKKAEEILDPEGQLKLKNEILESIGKIVPSDKITNIYFIDYIVQ